MDRAGQLLGEGLIDQPLARHAIESGKPRRNRGDMEMAFAAFPRPGMTRMLGRIVSNFELRRLQRLFQLAANAICDNGQNRLLCCDKPCILWRGS